LRFFMIDKRMSINQDRAQLDMKRHNKQQHWRCD